MTDLASADRPPAPSPPRRPGNGLVWASGLALVVLTVATVVAFTSGRDRDEPTQVDPDNPTELQGRDVTGEPVPTDVFERFDGGTLTGGSGSLADYIGRPTVVNFFASWCVPCIKEMPAFEAVHQDIGDRVAFVGVNTTEQPESGTRIIQQTGVTYDILRDPDGILGRRIDLLNMPATLFVDANGTIVRVHTGELSQAELEQIIRDDLLA